jgi:hypothetical protein
MTTEQLQAQRIEQVRRQLADAEVARYRATGGRDEMTLEQALEAHGADIALAMATNDVRLFWYGVKALRNYIAAV